MRILNRGVTALLFTVAAVWSARSEGLSEYVPVDWTGVDRQEQVATIRRLHDDYGFRRFVLIGPYRKEFAGDLTLEDFEELGDSLAWARRQLKDLPDVELGWWLVPTLRMNWSVQHLPADFELIHETDSYPHTRFYDSTLFLGSELCAAMMAGADGTYYYCTAYTDAPLEDDGYAAWMLENLCGEPRKDAELAFAAKWRGGRVARLDGKGNWVHCGMAGARFHVAEGWYAPMVPEFFKVSLK